MSARYPEEDHRPPWFVLTGLVIGILLGVAYAWWFEPVKYSSASPALLLTADKDQYRRMVALAFDSNHDVGRAAARLDLLGDADAAQSLESLSQRTLAEDGSPQEALALAGLAAALRIGFTEAAPSAPDPAVETPTPESTQETEDSPTATATIGGAVSTATPQPTPTLTLTPEVPPTPRPTRTATATPGSPYTLVENTPGCDPRAVPALLQVLVEDAAGQGVPGARVVVSWAGGEEAFFTGLAPEIGPGYADFVMTAGVLYSARVGEAGEVASEISAPACNAAAGSSYPGSVRLRFRQP